MVAFVHASGSGAPAPEWIAGLRDIGLRVFAHGPLPGCERLDAGWPRLARVCAGVAAAAPGCALLILRAPLRVDAEQLAELEDLVGRDPEPAAYTVLSNGAAGLNPYADLEGTDHERLRPAALVALLARRQLHPLDRVPAHCLLLSAAAVRVLAAAAEAAPDEAMARLGAAGGELRLAEWIYLHDPARASAASQELQAHESPRPRPWGGLSERLHEWLSGDPDRWPQSIRDPRPVTLHVSHSWGGGVAHWIRTFVGADPDGRHLQLLSEGPQSNQGAGQRLALYPGAGADGPAIERWWLQAPIQAVAISHPQYREVLIEVCRRFGVSRVIVSSLVGHSLEALQTRLPTVQVLHDHFPAWPLLSVHPQRFQGDLAAALDDPGTPREFPGMPDSAWSTVREAYLGAVREHGVRLAAPTRSVADIQAGLAPAWDAQPIEVIRHGVPELPGSAPVAPRPRRDGRLRLLVPGRMQEGKGRDLLLRALPAIAPHAQVYLLGASRGGEAFFGLPGVHVVLEYRRDTLARLVAAIGPDLAGLFSVVPETFSFMLSEMHQLGVPVLATRVGSFQERIDDGQNGWLVDPDAEALVARVAELAAAREQIDAVRARISAAPRRRPEEMVADYARLCPPAERPLTLPPAVQLDLAQAQAQSHRDELRRTRQALDAAGREQAGLLQELRARTDWAEATGRELAAEIERRKAWVASLERSVEETHAQLRESNRLLDRAHEEIAVHSEQRARAVSELKQVSSDLARIESEHQALSDLHAQVLASSSWRLTRPLRVLRRVGGNFLRARAWNPMRWPLLFSQLVRNLATVGVRGTVLRLQLGDQDVVPDAPQPRAEEVPESVDLPASLPCAGQPQVSIVIPVYNQLPYTAACLRSLAEVRSQVACEVIVVDDASTDATPDALPGVAGLRVLRNPENLGFIGSCNRGAREARGEFLVFLNNDTEVTKGWLEALLQTFMTRPDAGLVGARLLYPDGRLQECGGLVFRDGSGWNYGRGDDPARPEYRHLRETDYCSGACLAIRRELFARLEGFDSRYAPAYYEDTDLAFRVRAEGLKVYVQPAASVIHHEGVSSGTDLDSGVKQYQRVNQTVFRERWADQLAHQPPRIVDPDDRDALRRARDHRLRGRVLLVDAHTPEPDQDSGSVRLTRLMGCLQDLGYGVDFLPDNRAFAGQYTRALQAEGVRTWFAPWADSLTGFFREHGGEYAAIIVSRHYVAVNYASLIRRHCPQARFVFDTVDLHYLREQRLAELEGSAALASVARQTRRSELGVIREADATLVVSEAEREVLAGDAPGARVHLLSNIHVVRGRRADFAERSDLFFVGGYQHPPNIDAATWFVNDIWPLVRERLPGTRFHLVGSKAPEEVRALAGDGVVFHGFVPSLDPFLDRCRLAVAPLRYGAGVKGKVNHSMAHGQPVVATPAAVEGMHAEHQRDILVADSAAAFAQAVVRLYEDEELWMRLSDAGLENVRRHFSMEAAMASIQALFADLGVGQTP